MKLCRCINLMNIKMNFRPKILTCFKGRMDFPVFVDNDINLTEETTTFIMCDRNKKHQVHNEGENLHRLSRRVFFFF